MTDHWFIVHDLMAYEQHDDMICCKARNVESKRKRPMRTQFKRMELGDTFVYYAAGSYTIVGIFRVISYSTYFSDDVWPDVFVRKMEPYKMPPKGKYLDIKKLLFESDYEFEMFPKKEKWSMPLWGKTVKKISKNDFDKFLDNLQNEKYLVSLDDVRIPVTMWQKSFGNKRRG